MQLAVGLAAIYGSQPEQLRLHRTETDVNKKLERDSMPISRPSSPVPAREVLCFDTISLLLESVHLDGKSKTRSTYSTCTYYW